VLQLDIVLDYDILQPENWFLMWRKVRQSKVKQGDEKYRRDDFDSGKEGRDEIKKVPETI